MNTNQTPQSSSDLNYRKFIQLSSDKKSSCFIKSKELPDVDLNIEGDDKESFTKNYQELYTSIPGSKSYTLREILTKALPNSEGKFKQYEIKTERVKELARSIFIEHQWLIIDIVVGVLEKEIYLIGGRHRIFAIAHVFALLAKSKSKDEAQIQKLFDNYLEQSVRTIYIDIKRDDYLLPLLIQYNDSRRMRGAEIAHLEAQKFGANSEGITSISKASLNAEDYNKTIRIVAQNFARREHYTTRETRQRYGEYIGKWIIFGVKPGETLKKNLQPKVKGIEELDKTLDRAWKIFLEETKAETMIYRKVSEISKRIIERLEQENNQHSNEESKELVAAK
ncbi:MULTISPECIES: hypothetical protein [Calothrix]|uniref:ParB/Sulfiredoxin domain-containing protein n=2 Tax=Calothrix TaxID=1186 RepID=A0ABR8AIY0_9CYAN|nr:MULTISPECIES: hypothetical protein [Calothrix]MBD2199936.1 hypothetical protein [Calothrix parietina FACHB-288]MBD2228851.1 hypothetical protein [Calothrix anomala FACHB-343]